MSSHIEVLLVEDSFSDAQMVEAIVSSSDIERPTLHHAQRFHEALAMLKEKDYDLVLLDLHLPDGEGLGMIKQLKQQVPETPVVVLTGLQDDVLAVDAIKEGAQDYVLKSDTFSSTRLSKMGHTDLGNWLVRRMQYAIKRNELAQQLKRPAAIDRAPHRSTNVQHSPENHWCWDITQNTLRFSPWWVSLLGLETVARRNSDRPVEQSLTTGSTINGIHQWISCIHPEDKERFCQNLKAYLSHQQKQFYCEYRIRCTSGDYIWVLAQGTALWDANGEAYRMEGEQVDITARKLKEAAAYHKKEIAQTALHTVCAGLLSIHAKLYIDAGQYEEVEPLLESALAIRKSLLGREHPDVGISLYNLAALYDNQFQFAQAEALFKEALDVFEKTLGHQNPHTQQVRAKVSLICRLNQAIRNAHEERSLP